MHKETVIWNKDTCWFGRCRYICIHTHKHMRAKNSRHATHTNTQNHINRNSRACWAMQRYETSISAHIKHCYTQTHLVFSPLPQSVSITSLALLPLTHSHSSNDAVQRMCPSWVTLKGWRVCSMWMNPGWPPVFFCLLCYFFCSHSMKAFPAFQSQRCISNGPFR